MIIRENYFDVIAYLEYQEKILQYSYKTIDRKWAHLRHLLEWADSVPFPRAKKIEPTYPKYLETARNDGKEKSLSPNSMKRACLEARSFFKWAKLNKDSKYSKVKEIWIETIRPSRAKSQQSELVEREYYTLEEVRLLVNIVPDRLIEKRDRAAVAFLFLSGMRISAFVSLPIRCVDLDTKSPFVNQLPSEGVETKFNKAARTYLLPIPDLIEIVREWDEFIRSELSRNYPWYPIVNQDGTTWGDFENMGSTESRRSSFSRGLKRFCKRANLSYKSPHKFRNGHGVFGIKAAKTIKEFKSFSQNMMHSNMQITDSLYGHLANDEVKETISGLGIQSDNNSDTELFEEFLAFKRWQASQSKE